MAGPGRATSTGAYWSPTEPMPRRPFCPCPQHFTPPFVMSAQVCPSPGAITATPDVRPTTCVGTLRCWLSPTPRPPVPLYPQHFTPPAMSMAHMAEFEPPMTATPDDRPTTSTG